MPETVTVHSGTADVSADEVIDKPSAARIRAVDGTAATKRAPEPEPGPPRDLNSPELYLNRELTWLRFNDRVLYEAQDPHNPLLERVKFLAITASNLDEFFMKRIGGLKQQAVAGMQELTIDGRMPLQQIVECYERIRPFE